MKILIYDIETEPNLGYTWGKYEQNVLAYVKEGGLLSFSYKWLGDKTVHVVTREGQRSDRALTKKLWRVLNEADVTVTQNGKSFDHKKANTRMLFWGLKPPVPQRKVDTLVEAKKHFKFNSNRLDDMCAFLGIGRKVKHEGFELWRACMGGDSKAWARMRRYNKRDVQLTEKLYLRLRPWIDNHPNVGSFDGKHKACSKCGHTRLKSQGWRHTKTRSYRLYRCLKCQGFTEDKSSVVTANRNKESK